MQDFPVYVVKHPLVGILGCAVNYLLIKIRNLLEEN
jgi:glucokinase